MMNLALRSQSVVVVVVVVVVGVVVVVVVVGGVGGVGVVGVVVGHVAVGVAVVFVGAPAMILRQGS